MTHIYWAVLVSRNVTVTVNLLWLLWKPTA